MKQWFRALIGLALLTALVGIPLLLSQREAPQVQARLVALADEGSDVQSAGYLRVSGPKDLDFPADHGPHLDYQTEWWYYTGNLVADGGQRFGYQLTFFRRALVPPPLRAERESQWAADQVYMAHFALTDVAGRDYQAFERFSRGAVGLAGAQAAPFRVWLEDWQVAEVEPGVTRMRAQVGSPDAAESQGTLTLDLLLADRKGPILQGDRGFSPKGPQPGNASYYYSLTRLETSGTVQVGEASYQVSGLSWMDHEWSTSGLAADQIGWDWFSIQLDDGSELMVFQLRKEDGSIDLYSSGTFVAPDGSTRPLGHEDFEIRVEDDWRSPNSGATYPAGWAVVVPGLDLALSIEPYLSDQELIVSYAYWEGAVRVEGERAGQPVSGSGYVELTGYASSMQGQLKTGDVDMTVQKATGAEIEEALAELDSWTVESGKLHREYRFRDFVQAFGFMAQVALLAERSSHHPEWSNVYNRVVVDLTTHEAQGITQKDLDLARKIEQIAARM